MMRLLGQAVLEHPTEHADLVQRSPCLLAQVAQGKGRNRTQKKGKGICHRATTFVSV